ncbi:type III secretion system export apparatus subunit SctT [Halodesulfovibrio spirochaetisodalis]|uniref:type III secretion system export apparatus subunit SctT n=1 Tax=Halodesulfovibrio spirochaetisodalis TaxID=1560234 RepID=UPI00082EBC23|nr:type III secretion system export apparatus subunit SctT [Halodesulfovibrio spirochaetisodalis]
MFEFSFDPESLEKYIVLFSLCVPRLLIFFQVAPFMGGVVLSGVLRNGVAFTFVPFLFVTLAPEFHSLPVHTGYYKIFWTLGLLAKEVALGFVFAYLSGLFFWAMQSAGQLIDNQRGASMAQGSDPLSGEQSSPLASFFFQTVVYLFFTSGAFLLLVELLLNSYVVWSPIHYFPDAAAPSLSLFFVKVLGEFMVLVLLVASPMVIVCLLSDVGLGLINRFAQQLNVFSLSMAVKSFAVALLLVLYYSVFVRFVGTSFSELISFMKNVLFWDAGL